jgi:hypothetical protein
MQLRALNRFLLSLCGIDWLDFNEFSNYVSLFRFVFEPQVCCLKEGEAARNKGPMPAHVPIKRRA